MSHQTSKALKPQKSFLVKLLYIFIGKNTTACFAVKAPQVFLQKKRKINPKQTENAVLLTVVRGE